MGQDMIDLKTALRTCSPSCEAAVCELVRNKVKESSGLFSSKRSERVKWKTLEQKYQAGALNREDAEEIMIELQKILTDSACGRTAGRNAGAYSVIRESYLTVAGIIREDMENAASR